MSRERGPLLHHSNDRRLPAGYDGDVLVWDIDKTYLDTHFSTLRGLAAIPFELAVDKESIPGAVPLLRALRRGAGVESAIVPLYFVSGSPPQLRRVIERRMTMDGVEFDGITFKDQLGLLLAGRPRALRQQLGYKLSALLLYARAVPTAARWYAFGDDVEADAEVFVLFGAVCAGLRGDALLRRLREDGVDAEDAAHAVTLADAVPAGRDPVERIFIHLERGSDPARFAIDPRIVATRSYVQTALVLYQMGKIRDVDVAAVAHEMRRRRVPEERLQDHLADAAERLAVPPATLRLAQP